METSAQNVQAYIGKLLSMSRSNGEPCLRIATAQAAISLTIDGDGRLLQHAFGRGTCGQETGQPAYPAFGDGWVYEPALSVVHSDGNTSTDLRVVRWTRDGNTTRIELKDAAYPFFVDLFFRTFPLEDVFETWTVLRHEEAGSVTLDAYASSSFDFGAGEFWLTQFHGDWADEANMVEEKLGYGIKVLDSKLGVRAHQFRAPWFILSKGSPASEDAGEVFGGSLAWSGSFRFSFEMLPKGQLQAVCGINPFASTYHLEPGESFETPRMVWVWSGNGTGELSRKLHQYMRREVLRDGDRPRPVLLNNWEATYFDFDEKKIVSLFDGARNLGMELFLLDDGWFGTKYPRDGDTQGLGDWATDPKKLPNGIKALTYAAQEKGLRFGLWFEPEMVNPKSELFEAHPDWLIQQPQREHRLQRNQMVLDLTRPEVREFVYTVLDKTLFENPGISFVKWDCNRYLTQPGSPYLGPDRQSHLQVDYVRALYDVMARLAKDHPSVEVMMCSGGGGRVDYGAMQFAHELWPSDMTDPIRRIFIQWGFSHFIPAMATANHVTRWGGRPLKFCFDVAMSGRLGMDVDVDKLSSEERAYAASAIADYKGIREVVQLGELYRLESPYLGPRSALMFVRGDRAVAFVYAREQTEAGTIRLKGLDPTARFRVKEIGGETIAECQVSGSELMAKGLDLPALERYGSLVIELRREG
jgi:alpha-galactosidase